MGSLDIIIVNWNGGPGIRRCLDSIIAENLNGFRLQRVVVVDNGSSDESMCGLDKLRLPLCIISNPSNAGFAAACNQGAQGSEADYLLFLNPDTELFRESLLRPVCFLDDTKNKDVAIVGIQLVDERGEVSRTCARFPHPRDFYSKMTGVDRVLPGRAHSHKMVEWDHGTDLEVDQVIGAFFLVRRNVFEELRGFDERFFVYFEEVDFSRRAYEAGWRSMYLASVQAYHKGGALSEQQKGTRLFYSLRSRILYSFKHYGKVPAALLTIATLVVEPVARIVNSAMPKSWSDTRDVVVAYTLLWRHLISILRSAEK